MARPRAGSAAVRLRPDRPASATASLARHPPPARQIHPSLLQPPPVGRIGHLLPFTMEPTLHERPAAAASTLSGLDHGNVRRALHAFHNRPRGPIYEHAGLFAAEPPSRRFAPRRTHATADGDGDGADDDDDAAMDADADVGDDDEES